LKSVFANASAQIDRDYRASVAACVEQYGTDLTAARQEFRRAGDLDGVLQTDRELERFAIEKSCPPAGDERLPQRVREARFVCRRAVDKASSERKRSRIQLLQSYDNKLDAFQQALVRREQLDKAIRVRNERKRIEFIIADVETRMPMPDVKPEPEPPTPSPELPSGLSEGLVVFFDFDRRGVEKTMDRSGHGRHASVSDAQWVADARLPGDGAYDMTYNSTITCPMEAFAGNNASVSLWAKHGPLTDRQNDYNLFNLSGRGPNGGRLYSKPRFDHGTWHIGVGESRRSPKEKPDLGRWQLFTLVVRNGKASLYLDGKLTTFSIESPPFETGKQLVIGGRGECPSVQIDEFMVWKRPLSKEEVSLLYENSVRKREKRSK